MYNVYRKFIIDLTDFFLDSAFTLMFQIRTALYLKYALYIYTFVIRIKLDSLVKYT